MYIFIRKAGFWNAKKYNIGSQFGHIMLCINDDFYSFNQRKFLNDPEHGCVQVIDKQFFCEKYNRQIWHIIELSFDSKDEEKVKKYFLEIAVKHNYSFKNNCTLECQRALEYAGMPFFDDFILPGSVLAYLHKPHKDLQVKKITKVEVSKKLPI